MSGLRAQIEVVWIVTGSAQPPSPPAGVQAP